MVRPLKSISSGMSVTESIHASLQSLFSIARAARPLTFSIALLLSSTAAPAQETAPNANPRSAEDTLVRVNITTETRGTGERVVINGREISDYRPRIIQIFPATGIVIDDSGPCPDVLGLPLGRYSGKQPPD